MSSRIETLCILLLCLFGLCCSALRVEKPAPDAAGSFILHMPGIPVGFEVTTVSAGAWPCDPQ